MILSSSPKGVGLSVLKKQIAVLHKAFAILDEMEKGTFEYFLVSPGNEIVDDFIEQSERCGFISVEETKQFFAEKGIKS